MRITSSTATLMGYEIAGGLGRQARAAAARRRRDAGDGSYLMMNSEIATSVAMGLKLTIVLLDNRGFGCINRLQGACGGDRSTTCSTIAHPIRLRRACACARRALAEVGNIRSWKRRSLHRARSSHGGPGHRHRSAAEHCSGGAWWDVAVPEVSSRANVSAAYETYRAKLAATKKDP